MILPRASTPFCDCIRLSYISVTSVGQECWGSQMPHLFTLLRKGRMALTALGPSASTPDLIAGRALDANGRYVNHVLDDPHLMAPFQPEPVGRLGGVFVFGDHHQLAGLLDVVSDLLGAAEARPLPEELHFHKNQYRVGSDFNHGVPPYLLNRRPLRKIRRRGGPANAARGQGP